MLVEVVAGEGKICGQQSNWCVSLTQLSRATAKRRASRLQAVWENDCRSCDRPGGLFIDQLDYKSDEEGEQQGRYADHSPKWREAPGKFDDTVSEQVDGDEGQNQEEEADIFAAEYLHEGESVAGADPEFAVGD